MRKSYFRTALIFVLGLFTLSNNALGQSSPEYKPTLIAVNDIYQLDEESGDFESVQQYEFLKYENLGTLEWQLFLSHRRNTLVYWDENEPLSDGLWFLDLQTNSLYENLHVNSNEAFSYLSTEWAFGERFSLIEVGLYEDVEFLAHPQPRVTDAWLIDFEENSSYPWYWDCNQVIELIETNSFGLFCTLAEYATDGGQPHNIILAEDGIITDEFPAYTIVHTLTENDFDIGWEFSRDGTKVAFRDARTVRTSRILVYDLTTEISQPLAETQWDDLIHIYWSTSDNYLMIRTVADTEIRQVDGGTLIWSMSELIEDDVHLVSSDFAWKSTEDGFYLTQTTQSGGEFGHVLYDFSIVNGEAILNHQWDTRGGVVWVVDMPVQ